MALYSYPTRIRFQDIDAAGIIFYARVFDLFHDAYLAWMGSHGVDFPKVVRDQIWGVPLVHAEADYKKPLLFGDEVAVEITAFEKGTSSLGVRYRVRGASEDDVRATGTTKHVFVSIAERRPCPIPAEVLRALGG